MSEESTVVYFYDEELRQHSKDQLEQLTLQTELLQAQEEKVNSIIEINICLLVVLGAVLGAIVFRHLRK